MKKTQPINVAASVHQRLLNLSRERGEDFQIILTRYALERFLYRLVQSGYGTQFVLKGAMLFAIWTGRPHRPTRDLDLLGYGDASQEGIRTLFQEICLAQVEPDGLNFDDASVQVMEIRDNQEYGGQRVRLVCKLGAARITIQIDIGFGDVVTPEAKEIEYPTLLDLPAPRIRAYPPESVVAEKLQAMVVLGMVNSRMRDFYDLRIMAANLSFEGSTLSQAIRATFNRRKTEIPKATPTALSSELATDSDKIKQWKAFLGSNRLKDVALDFSLIIDELRTFLIPPLFAAANDEPFNQSWTDGGPWS